jgi:hypothetical protein
MRGWRASLAARRWVRGLVRSLLCCLDMGCHGALVELRGL